METTAHVTTSLSPSAHGKQNVGPSNHGDSHAVSKRLQSELMSLMASADPGVSAFPDGDSLFSWLGTIQGVQGTVYEALTYKLSLRFPSGELQFHLQGGSGTDLHEAKQRKSTFWENKQRNCTPCTRPSPTSCPSDSPWVSVMVPQF